MTGDDGSHVTGFDPDWFSENMSEVIVVPFDPEGSDNTETVQLWVDGTEAIHEVAGVTTCDECEGPCDSNFTGDDICYEHTNPELRPDGSTPLGRSLFYAGEYLRRFVLVEGKPCSVNAECASPNHTCIAGECRDPLKACRENIIVLFTDGGETENSSSSDFYNPVNQAKRLHMGLSCNEDAECAPGSNCHQGHCMDSSSTSVAAEVFSTPNAGYCSESVEACDLMAFGTECGGGFCQAPENTYSDTSGVQTLRGWNNNPIQLKIHVIDASSYPDSTNVDIAFWGGGQYINVDAADYSQIAEAILAVTDIKPNIGCQ
jgi:hypothetical protein